MSIGRRQANKAGLVGAQVETKSKLLGVNPDRRTFTNGMDKAFSVLDKAFKISRQYL